MIIIISLVITVLLYSSIQFLYRKYWDSKLNIDVSFTANHVHEGETSSIEEVIINDKMLSLPILEVFFNLDKGIRYVDMSNATSTDKLYRRDVFNVGIKRKITRTFDIECNNRGYYTLNKYEYMSTDLFMIYKFLGQREIFKDLYVFPRKVRTDRILLPYKKIMGDILVQKKLYDDPFSFGGIRDYSPSDPMNSINWKASAKSQELVVNIYDSSINQEVIVVLDTFKNDNFAHKELNEESIRIASSLIERLFVQCVELSLKTNALDAITKEAVVLNDLKGLGISMVKQSLARLDLGSEEDISSLIESLPRDKYVVIISKNPEIENVIKDSLEEYLWILPHQFEPPKISLPKKSCMFWEYTSGD